MKKLWIHDVIHAGINSKIWKIMRLSVLILSLSLFQLWADSGYAQQTKLSMNLNNARVVDVLDEIENQSDYYFLFNQKLVDVDRKVDLDTKETSIDNVLVDLFAGTDVRHQVSDHLIILTTEKQDVAGVDELPAAGLNPADIEVTGRVIDENGEGLPTASVSVRGTNIGVVTDLEGNYRITVDESAVLIFRFMGYMQVEEPVAGRTIINVSLEPEATELGEVVVTGYQTLSKERVTGSFETMTADVIQQRPTNNFISRLDGLASGVTINEGKVEVRGRSTILGNANPL